MGLIKNKLTINIILFLMINKLVIARYWRYPNYEQLSWNRELQIPQKHSVTLTVYYETLCPASVNFFVRQLKPATEKLAPYLDIYLVPYGHAQTFRRNGRYVFRCQHGAPECFFNKLHACVIDTLDNSTQAVLFNACLMERNYFVSKRGYDYSSTLSTCSNELSISTYGMEECVQSERGSELLKAYGDETLALRLHYVPYVLVDNSVDKQHQALGNLMYTVCQMLNPKPTTCYH